MFITGTIKKFGIVELRHKNSFVFSINLNATIEDEILKKLDFISNK